MNSLWYGINQITFSYSSPIEKVLEYVLPGAIQTLDLASKKVFLMLVAAPISCEVRKCILTDFSLLVNEIVLSKPF